MLSDIRYISLRDSVRDPIIEAHISRLSPGPTNLDVSAEEYEAQSRQKQERERRALADRQTRVEDEKRKARRALKFSKGLIREGEQELERATRIGKEGLLGYIEDRDGGDVTEPM